MRVEDDPEEQRRRAEAPSKPVFAAAVTQPERLLKPASGVALLTAELKAMSSDELRAGGERYRALLEARDVEDVLYS